MKQPVKPDFVIAGAAKCGTSALYEYLRSHPGILMPIRKDLHFFATDLPGKQRVRSWSAYRRSFAESPGGRLVGEASALYLFSRQALPAISAANPDARIIAIIRNPIEVAIAYHAQQVFNLSEDVTDFEAAWRLRGIRRSGERLPARCPEPGLLQYQEVASLGTQVQRLLSVFPASQVKLILFDDFKADTRQVYEQILAFLGLPPGERREFPRINERKVVRLAWLKRLEQSVKVPLLLSKTVDTLGLRRLKERMYQAPARPYRPDSTFARELAQTFDSEIDTLSRLFQRDLTPWKELREVSPARQEAEFRRATVGAQP